MLKSLSKLMLFDDGNTGNPATSRHYCFTTEILTLFIFNADNHRANTVLAQLQFLGALTKKLENEEERESVIKDFEEIRSILTSSENMILHISTNVKRLAEKYINPTEILSRMFPENAIPCQKR
jgi:hypothetical protein